MSTKIASRILALCFLFTSSLAALGTPTPLQSRAMAWAAKTPASAMQSTTALAKYLSQISSDEQLKALAILCWEVRFLKYDYESFEGWKNGVSISASQDAADVLARRTAVCQGYSELFADLAQKMNLEAVVVTGFAKGANYAPGDVFDEPCHAWNAIRIDGKWQLVDATWADCRSTGYEPEWYHFCTAPSEMIYSHIPAEARWFLMDEGTSLSKFQRQPIFFPDYFKLGCYDYSPKKTVITNTGQSFRIALNVVDPLSITASVGFTPANGEQAFYLQHEMKYMPWGIVITCTLPAEARGTINVFAGPAKSFTSSCIIQYGVQPAQPAL